MTSVEIFRHFVETTRPVPFRFNVTRALAKYQRRRAVEDGNKSDSDFRELVEIARRRKANPIAAIVPLAASNVCSCGAAYGSAHGLRAHLTRCVKSQPRL